METLLKSLSNIMDAFGSSIIVPVILFLISLFLKVPMKKAFQSALNAGIGLTGFNFIIGAYTPIVTPVVQRMVEATGVQLNILDTGWQAASVVAYATEAGMIFLGLGLVLQLILFATKYTDMFLASDLWNNYSYMLWGSMLYIITRNIWLSLGLMIVMNLITITLAEIHSKRWSTFYGYPGTTIVASHDLAALPIGIAVDWILNKLGADRIKVDTDTLQERFGVLGEAPVLGFILGMLIGLAGNFMRLDMLVAWGEIFTLAISTAAIMAIFPRVASIFSSAFTSITDAARKSNSSSEDEERDWYLGINDAAGYGEPATLSTGLILIPIILVIAIFAPGNQALPLVDLIAIPYMLQAIVPLSNGNIFKSVISGTVYLTLGLYLVTAIGPIFTEVATDVGFNLPEGALMIFSLAVLTNLLGGILFFVFMTQNPLFIILTFIFAFGFQYIAKKNKDAIHEYLERTALGDEYVRTEEKGEVTT